MATKQSFLWFERLTKTLPRILLIFVWIFTRNYLMKNKTWYYIRFTFYTYLSTSLLMVTRECPVMCIKLFYQNKCLQKSFWFSMINLVYFHVCFLYAHLLYLLCSTSVFLQILNIFLPYWPGFRGHWLLKECSSAFEYHIRWGKFIRPVNDFAVCTREMISM